MNPLLNGVSVFYVEAYYKVIKSIGEKVKKLYNSTEKANRNKPFM